MNETTVNVMEERKVDAEIAKIMAETVKLNKETKYYVLGLILSSTVVGALIALISAWLTWHFTKS